jgi:hypothetical protein
MFNNIDGIFNTTEQTLQRVALLEEKLKNLPISNQAYFVQGRLRTDRAAPANSADVTAQDLIYDRVLTDAFEYILINNAGTLAWRQVTLSAF